MAGPSGRKEGLRCECGKLLLEKHPEMGFGVRCGRRECDKFHTLEEINQRAAEFKNKKENGREKMEGEKSKTLNTLKKIIKKAMKDEENVVDLTMIGKNSFSYGTYTFTKEGFRGIKDNIVIFDGYSLAPIYVPLVNVESIEVRKKAKMPGNLAK